MSVRKKKSSSFLVRLLPSEVNRKRLALGFISIWILILTGILDPLTGTPGLIQYFKMGQSIEQRKAVIKDLEAQRDRLEKENLAMSTNPYAQQREIRRVLGYARPGELIFDFGELKR